MAIFSILRACYVPRWSNFGSFSGIHLQIYAASCLFPLEDWRLKCNIACQRDLVSQWNPHWMLKINVWCYDRGKPIVSSSQAFESDIHASRRKSGPVVLTYTSVDLGSGRGTVSMTLHACDRNNGPFSGVLLIPAHHSTESTWNQQLIILSMTITFIASRS